MNIGTLNSAEDALLLPVGKAEAVMKCPDTPWDNVEPVNAAIVPLVFGKEQVIAAVSFLQSRGVRTEFHTQADILKAAVRNQYPADKVAPGLHCII